jgi:hypothetical protein
MGAPAVDSPSGLRIVTSADTVASAGFSSGRIGSQATLTSFTIADGDRVANKANVAATFTFTASSGGATAAGGLITLLYPAAFFASNVNGVAAQDKFKSMAIMLQVLVSNQAAAVPMSLQPVQPHLLPPTRPSQSLFSVSSWAPSFLHFLRFKLQPVQTRSHQ